MLKATLVREKKDSWRESFHLRREYMNNYDQNVGRNVDVKGHVVTSQMGNEEHIIGNWRKSSPC